MKKVLFFIAIVFSIYAKAADTTFVTVNNVAKTATITVVDKVTGSTLNANVSNIIIQNNNPEFATVSTNAINPRAIDVSPVASGSGTATVNCHVVYTDPGDGLQKSEDKVIVIAYTVTYTPPHGSKLSLTFN